MHTANGSMVKETGGKTLCGIEKRPTDLCGVHLGDDSVEHAGSVEHTACAGALVAALSTAWDHKMQCCFGSEVCKSLRAAHTFRHPGAPYLCCYLGQS
jgi:hypothetical protein